MTVKKCTGILLALLLLASNTGLAVSVHYCGGEIASVKALLLSSKDDLCGMPKSMGCCKTKIVKADKSHETIVKAFSFSFDAPFVAPEITFIPNRNAVSFIEKPAATYFCEANPPPLFKLYSHYIFYA